MSEDDHRPIVFCYDGSDGAKRALESSSTLLTGRPARVITVWRSAWDEARTVALASIQPDVVEHLDREAERGGRELAHEGAELVPGSQPMAVKAHRSTWQTILEYTDSVDAAAIVVGSRGRGELRSAILGSVSHGLVNHAHRPVLVVPPEQ
jgi:nucleotide-binding universal stress UspA family protein